MSNREIYLAWLNHLIRVHTTEAWSNGQTEEQQTEEDRLNEYWDELDDELRQRLWGLSADLNSLRDEEVVIASDWPPISEEELNRKLLLALEQHDWDNALELLRRPPQTLSRTEQEAKRADCWNGLGHADVAELFSTNALRLADAVSISTVGPTFRLGDVVTLRATLEMGRVEAEPKLEAGEYWYRVRFSKRIENVVEDDLESIGEVEESLESLATEGKWGRLQAVRCALGIERIRHTNRSTLYAFQSQRILFEPYQYKPLLKVLDSPDRRLLIADEVGLGKTIEAGLVITELDARKTMDRVLVVCPSRLRDKWRIELNGKFEQDFTILDKNSFLQEGRRAQDSPSRFRMRGIMSMQSMRGEEVRESLTSEIGHLDMVIVDEAHHARNKETATSELLRELCEVADCVLLLTATPMHLKNEDLFTLVNALRPSEFRDAYVFDNLLQRHAPVHIASALARTQDSNQLNQIAGLLSSVFRSPFRTSDPVAEHVISEIETVPPANRREWVELERQIQDLHPLGSIVTRTRKRDVVENAPERRARTIRCEWTPEEDQAYQRLVQGSGSLGWFNRPMTLGQIQRARQAASCLPATFNAQISNADGSSPEELSDILAEEIAGVPIGDEFPVIDYEWTGEDSKLAKLKTTLADVWRENPSDKVLIFTYFKGTARYLENMLSTADSIALRIDGDVVSDPRRPERDERGKRIRQFQEDIKSRILISTEVGSEGLDFQFCHHLVNYDLPWNPMVVEQRIGRIDRFGQESKVLHIHNFVVKGTVEDEILERLYSRIGLFEQSIGNLETILGETMSELRRDFVSGKLTPSEAARRVEQAANAIDRKTKDLERLEKEASELFGHEEFIREEMNRIRNLGRYVSEHSILSLLNSYFESHHPEVKIKPENPHIYACRMTENLRHAIHDAARGGPTWVDRSKDGVLFFTTSGEIAFRKRELDLINASHPLVRAATSKVQKQMDSPRARIGQAKLRLVDVVNNANERIEPGNYFLLLFAHTINSIRSRRILETVAWHRESDAMVESDLSERLLYLVVEHGLEWDDVTPASGLSPDVWQILSSEAMKRNRMILAAEDRENRALYVRRHNAIEAEFQHQLAVKERRFRTAQMKGRTRILSAMKGQIEKAQSDYRVKISELEQQQETRASLSEPIAACAIRVVL